MKLFDKAKDAAGHAAVKAKEGVAEIHVKRELHLALEELGSKSFDLVEAGKIEAPELAGAVEKIRNLNARVAESVEAEE